VRRSRRWFNQACLLTAGGAIATLTHRRRAQAQNRIRVTTADELVAAIGPNRTLELASGSFVISDVGRNSRNPYVSFRSVFDGEELVITGVENLTLVGADNALTRVMTRPRYAEVLKFTSCSNLRLHNLELSHTPESGFCRGGVVSFILCDGVEIDRCVLYGSGIYGILATNLTNLSCRTTVIRECTDGILCLEQSADLTFEDCQFFDNAGLSMIQLDTCDRVRFARCLMHDNYRDDVGFLDEYDLMFHIWQSSPVELTDCRLHDNQIPYLAPRASAIALSNTTFDANTFDDAPFYPRDRALSPPFPCYAND